MYLSISTKVIEGTPILSSNTKNMNRNPIDSNYITYNHHSKVLLQYMESQKNTTPGDMRYDLLKRLLRLKIAAPNVGYLIRELCIKMSEANDPNIKELAEILASAA